MDSPLSTIKCPQCGSEAFNLYGHLKNGVQRYICLVCDRQFVNRRTKAIASQRPVCPSCGRSMHIYMQHPDTIRFRCSRYPGCHGYAKLKKDTKPAD